MPIEITPEMKKSFWKWLKNQPSWLKALIVALLAAIAVVSILIAPAGCTTAHNVTQSTSSASYRIGDTTVTEVTIRYEQVGKLQK